MRANGKTIIRDLLKTKELTHKQLADRLNISRPLVGMRLKHQDTPHDMYADILAETLSALDYKLVAVPQSTLLPVTAYEVSPRVPHPRNATSEKPQKK